MNSDPIDIIIGFRPDNFQDCRTRRIVMLSDRELKRF